MICNLANKNFETDYIRNLLAARGIVNMEEYLLPGEYNLCEPELLDNIEEGKNLLLKTLGDNGKILIIVDSDNDGFTSAAIMYNYIQNINPGASVSYVLHAEKQHGLEDHIDRLIAQGKEYDLIIAPDSSTNDYDYHERLKEIGTAILVLDHHDVDASTCFSDNAVIINNQLSSQYSNKALTGAGVVFQFCRYLDKCLGVDFANQYMDLAAWGIIGDMGDMRNLENRYIAYHGLNHINNKFMWEIIKKREYSIAGTTGASDEKLLEAINCISVAFYIVPYVNAMIRVGEYDQKVRMFEAFIDGDKLIPSNKRGAKGTLARAAEEVVRECGNAHNKQSKTVEKAMEELEIKIYKHGLLDNKILFIRLDKDNHFPSTLNGLLAMQLTNKFKRPVIVARMNDEEFVRGSIRGLNDSTLVDFKEFLLGTGLFEYVQGHPNAAGCSIHNSQLDKLHTYANEALKSHNFNESIQLINFQRRGDDADLTRMIEEVSSYKSIWGQNNPEPKVHIYNIYVDPKTVKVMGQRMDTLKFEYNGISYIKFFAKEMIEEINSFANEKIVNIQIVGKCSVNEWAGRITPQIIIDKYEISKINTDF